MDARHQALYGIRVQSHPRWQAHLMPTWNTGRWVSFRHHYSWDSHQGRLNFSPPIPCTTPASYPTLHIGSVVFFTPLPISGTCASPSPWHCNAPCPTHCFPEHCRGLEWLPTTRRRPSFWLGLWGVSQSNLPESCSYKRVGPCPGRLGAKL